MFKGRLKRVCLCAAAFLMILGSAVTAKADTAISEVKVTLTHRYDDSGAKLLEPQISVGGQGYKVESAEWAVDAAEWKPGERVTAHVYLQPEEGREFSYYYPNESVSVENGSCLTFWKKPDGRMYIKAAYYPVVQLGRTEKAGWRGSDGMEAAWQPVPYATAYQLRLYWGKGNYVTTLNLRGTSVDLSGFMTPGNSYYYEVRATSKDSTDSLYRENGEYVLSERYGELESSYEMWYQTIEGWRYVDSDGKEVSDGWRYIEGSWYYFNRDGYMETGWCELNGKWYYMHEDGKMHIGWLEKDGKRYYLDSTGVMTEGWYQMSPSVWYYFYEDGSMAADTVVDGCTIGADGVMIE